MTDAPVFLALKGSLLHCFTGGKRITQSPSTLAVVEIRIGQTDPIIIFFLQSLLASVSKPTKLALGRVGLFSVASLNAIVSLYYIVVVLYCLGYCLILLSLIGVLSNWDGYVIQQLVSQTKTFNSIQRKGHKFVNVLVSA